MLLTTAARWQDLPIGETLDGEQRPLDTRGGREDRETTMQEARAELAQPLRRMSRREFLVAALGAMVGLLLAVPLLGALLAPLLRRTVERRWAEAGRVDDLPVLEPRAFRVSLPVGARVDPEIDREVYAVRGVDGSLVVLLNECTHLGCPVRWLPQRRLFYCPCHRGYFNVMGYDVTGPPPHPLYRLRHRVENGVLFVSNEKLPEEA